MRLFSRSSAARSSGPRTSGSRLVTLAIALALAFGLLFATRQINTSAWYSVHYPYRAQVDAMLQGRLALSPSPDGLSHDLAWTPSGTQQVWGLGVPLLQLPFELIGRAIGVVPFPDRIAMAAWIGFAFFVLLRAFRGWAGVGALLITGLLPGLITMLRCRMQVYEDAALYAYLAAMILVGGLVIFARAPKRWQYLLLVACAGATGLIRPTVWFYGVGAALAATVIWWRAGGRKSIAVGALLFVLGGGALYATNAVRFGRGSEFGHQLNIESLPGNIVATRFSYPFERVGTVVAAKELVGALFDRPEQRSVRGFYQKQLHAWQAPVPRWREYYFTTFSWPYVPLLLAGLVLGGLAVRRRDLIGAALFGFAFVGMAPLLVFYLHSPSVSSRYQLDFAPAFAVLILLGWRELAARVDKRIALPIAIALWAAAVVTSKAHRPTRGSDPVTMADAENAYEASRAMPDEHDLPDLLDLDDPLLPVWTESEFRFEHCLDESGARISCTARMIGGDVHLRGIDVDRQWYVSRHVVEERWDVCALDPFDPRVHEELDTVVSFPALYLDGFGWRIEEDGGVPVSTLFYVHDPQFLEVEIYGGDPAKVRVAIGLQHLARVETSSTTRGIRIRFESPVPLPPGLQVAFIAFGDDTTIDLERSSYQLKSVRWR